MREVQGYPLPLGVQISENKINFSIAVPTEKKCQFCLAQAVELRQQRNGHCEKQEPPPGQVAVLSLLSFLSS